MAFFHTAENYCHRDVRISVPSHCPPFVPLLCPTVDGIMQICWQRCKTEPPVNVHDDAASSPKAVQPTHFPLCPQPASVDHHPIIVASFNTSWPDWSVPLQFLTCLLTQPHPGKLLLSRRFSASCFYFYFLFFIFFVSGHASTPQSLSDCGRLFACISVAFVLLVSFPPSRGQV